MCISDWSVSQPFVTWFFPPIEIPCISLIEKSGDIKKLSLLTATFYCNKSNSKSQHDFDFKKWNISRVLMIPVSSTTPCYLYPLTVFSKLHDFCIVLSWVLHVIYNESKNFSIIHLKYMYLYTLVYLGHYNSLTWYWPAGEKTRGRMLVSQRMTLTVRSVDSLSDSMIWHTKYR